MGPLVILLGAVVAWSGWQGISAASVIQSAAFGWPVPAYRSGAGFTSVVSLPLEGAFGIANAVGQSIVDGIQSIWSGITGGIGGILGGGSSGWQWIGPIGSALGGGLL